MMVRADGPSSGPAERIGGPALALVVIVLASAAARAGDAWPTYRGDAVRSGWSDARLPERPAPRWRWLSPLPPRPAWPAAAAGNLLQNVRKLNRWDASDRVFHPVVAGGRVVFGSSVDDAVHCLALGDGTPLWRHDTGGPVRMPPAIGGGRVFAASDDGFVRCLTLADGGEVWRHRLGPEDRALPGNSRLISRWPVRGGPIVLGDTLVVAAGVFPLDGVFLAALDPQTGAVRWQRGLDTVAHGPLVASPDRVFVTALRAGPTVYEIATGSPRGALPGGGALALFRQGTLVTGAAETGGLQGVDAAVQQAIVVRDGFQCVSRGERLVAASERMLVACDGRGLRWKVECPGIAGLIAAGDTVVAGGHDEVIGFDADTGRERWRLPVTGVAVGLAAVDGTLLVATDRGELLAFGAGPPVARPVAAAAAAEPEANELATMVAAIAAHVDCPGGYAAVFGSRAEGLAVAVARRTGLHAVGFVPAGDVPAGRGRLAAAGLLGHAVTLEPLAGAAERYEAGVFNVIVVTPDDEFALSAREAVRLAVPDRGLVVLTASAGDPAAARFAAGTPLGDVLQTQDTPVTCWRTPARRGAGSWTHPFADPGNTACSGDELVKPPFETHWFGPPGPEAMVDRHNRTSPPLAADGRLFVAALDEVIAVDAANGAPLWRRRIEDSSRLAVSKNCGHMVAEGGRLFVAVRDACEVLTATSGARLRRIPVPEDGVRPAQGWEWGYLAVAGGRLVGSRSEFERTRRELASNSWERGYLDHSPLVTADLLFAHDPADGRLIWKAPLGGRVVVNTALAVAEGAVFGVEMKRPAPAKLPGGRARLTDLLAGPSELVARSLTDGAPLWRRPVTIPAQHSLFSVATAGTVLLASSRNDGAGLICHLQAFAASDGRPLWETSETTGLPVGGSHGEQEQHPLVVAGKVFFKTFACDLATGATDRTWKMPLGGCGAPSGSRHAAFFRAGTAWCTELATATGGPLTGVTRPGCWLNMLPAGGLLLAPESSAGCTCQYPIQTSLAMRPLAEPPPTVTIVGSDGGPLAGDCEFVGRLRVAVQPATAGSRVRVALGEGGWPTPETPAASGPIVIDAGDVLRARSFSAAGRGGLLTRRFVRVDTPRITNRSRVFVADVPIAFDRLPGDAEIRYRTDGTVPTAADRRYDGPFCIGADADVVAAYFLDGVPLGPPVRGEFRRTCGLAAVAVSDLEGGLAYDYYEGDGWTRLPDCDALEPLRSGRVPRFVVPDHRPDGFAVRYRGYIRLPEDGLYRFFLRSDDGSDLRVGGRTLITNDGVHDGRGEVDAEVLLAAGWHAIEVRYFDAAIGEVLRVACEGPGFGKREIPGDWLGHVPADRKPAARP